MISIYNSSQIDSVEGRLHLENGKVKVERLIYHLNDGQRLDASDTEIVKLNATALAMMVPCHWHDGNDRFIRSGSRRKVSLHRTNWNDLSSIAGVN